MRFKLSSALLAVSVCSSFASAASAGSCDTDAPGIPKITITCASDCRGTTGCQVEPAWEGIWAQHKAPAGEAVEVCFEVAEAPEGTVKIRAKRNADKDVENLFRANNAPLRTPGKGTPVRSGAVQIPEFDRAVDDDGEVHWIYKVVVNKRGFGRCKVDPEICVRGKAGGCRR